MNEKQRERERGETSCFSPNRVAKGNQRESALSSSFSSYSLVCSIFRSPSRHRAISFRLRAPRGILENLCSQLPTRQSAISRVESRTQREFFPRNCLFVFLSVLCARDPPSLSVRQVFVGFSLCGETFQTSLMLTNRRISNAGQLANFPRIFFLAYLMFCAERRHEYIFSVIVSRVQ